MEFEHQDLQGVKVVKPLGTRLDAAVAEEFQKHLVEMMTGGHNLLVLDFSEVGFMDSSGLTAVVSSFKKLNQQHGGAMAVCGLQKALESLFRLTQLDKVMKAYANAQEAAGALSAARP